MWEPLSVLIGQLSLSTLWLALKQPGLKASKWTLFHHRNFLGNFTFSSWTFRHKSLSGGSGSIRVQKLENSTSTFHSHKQEKNKELKTICCNWLYVQAFGDSRRSNIKKPAFLCMQPDKTCHWKIFKLFSDVLETKVDGQKTGNISDHWFIATFLTNITKTYKFQLF